MIVGSGPSAIGGGIAESARFSRSISTISPGSLSSVYRAMKTMEVASAATGVASLPSAPLPTPPSGEAVVHSAQGVPGALAAYGEVIGDA